ncbi:polygalacturonase-like [Cornus florida]|uniref:polygalacturonase-like n=1 Tax=Cornus florida TaxID=4283 RepID=UPI00289CE5B9|nr:polygalacturonase-like [Cornus florida]
MSLRSSLKAISALLILAHVAEGAVFDVTKYGARPNADLKPALLKAWSLACSSRTPSTVMIPAGTYPLSPVIIQGPCVAPVGVQLRGTLKAPPLSQITTESWVAFQRIDRFTLSGGGIFDGMGADAWKKTIDCSTNTKCKRPTSIRFNFVKNAVIHDITSKDAKQFHITVLGGNDVTFQRLTIVAPEASRNTDGIHIGRSINIKVLDSRIGTGDDCVSIGDGAQQVKVERVTCGPGHGISVGSLGKYANEQPVSGIIVKDCSISKTMNGVRIKTWPGSPPSTASDMHFENITMTNVGNPIVINQNYCDVRLKCPPKPPSKVKISKVSFKNIKGSSSTEVGVKLVCSSALPCENVELGNIQLTYNGRAAKSELANIKPITSGRINVALTGA